jgi:hypothetical protein
MRFRFIEDRRADHPVTIMCDVLGVSPAGYYAWRARPESPRAAANRELVNDIKRGSPRHQWPLWQPARPCRVEGSGARGEPRSHRAIDAPPRYQGHHGKATTGAHHRQPSRLPDRPEPARTQLHRRRTEPDLARRHHLYRDRSELALSGHGHGPLQPQDRRLGDGRSFARRTATGRLGDGCCDTAAWLRPDPPFRSWRSIRLGGVSQDDAVRRLPRLDEPQGRLLRQRSDGELLPYAQNRTRPSPALCNTRGSQT